MKQFWSALILGLFTMAAAAQNPPQDIQLAPVPAPEHKSTRIRISGSVAAANLLERPQPVYPPLARDVRLSGTVRLHAVIAKDGRVLQLEVVSGHPLLVQFALDAVHQWRYKPTLLNGEPVEVDTTVDIIYSLEGDSQEKQPQLMRLAHQPIDPVFRADLVKLMELTSSAERAAIGARKVMEPMRPVMFRNVGDEALRQKIIDAYEGKLVALFKTEGFQEGVITAYAKYFNDGDVKALIAFYDTPLGRKFNEAMPQFTSDMMELGQRLAADRVPGILKELCEEYPDDLGGKLRDCPSPDKDKKSRLSMPFDGIAATISK